MVFVEVGSRPQQLRGSRRCARPSSRTISASVARVRVAFRSTVRTAWRLWAASSEPFGSSNGFGSVGGGTGIGAAVVDVDIALSEWSAMLEAMYKDCCEKVKTREDGMKQLEKKNIVPRETSRPAYAGGLFRPVERRAM